MKNTLHSIFFLIITTAFLQSSAQSYSVEAITDTNKITIGEQINVKLKVSYRVDEGDISVQFPVIYDSLISKVEVVSKSAIDTVIPDKSDPYQFYQEQNIVITSFDSGLYSIPPFLIIVNADTVETETFLIEVNTLEVDTAKGIFDIKAPISEPFSIVDWLKDNWVWLVAILVAAILIYVLVKYLKNRTPKLIEEPNKPAIPCHVTALQKLEQLGKEQLWQNGKIKLYHTQLSEIIREYIEKRYQINALEATTPEIIHQLRLQLISAEQMNKLTQLLTLTDLVKFAKEQPLANENELGLLNAVAFIEATKETTTQNSNA